MFFETMGNVSKIGLRHSLMALLHGVVASAQAATALLHGVERSAQAATGLLHGVERCAQARDGFTTWCRKVRASPRRVYYMV